MSKVRAKSQLTKYQLHKKANESGYGLTERSRAYYAKRHNDHLNSDTLFAQVHYQRLYRVHANKTYLKALDKLKSRLRKNERS